MTGSLMHGIGTNFVQSTDNFLQQVCMWPTVVLWRSTHRNNIIVHNYAFGSVDLYLV